jgi:hypothetical protein
MYVVRLKSIDGIYNFKICTSRRLALSNFEAGHPNSWAICLLSLPLTTRAKTSASRGVKLASSAQQLH